MEKAGSRRPLAGGCKLVVVVSAVRDAECNKALRTGIQAQGTEGLTLREQA